MKAKVKLFTSITCPNCPSAKNEISELKKQRDDFDLNIIEVTTIEGSNEAKKENIMSVPTYIISGPGVEHNIGLIGAQGFETLNKYIDISLGLRKLDEKKSFWKKIFN